MSEGASENGFWPGATTPDLALGTRAMSSKTSAVENDTATTATRRIDSDRIHRALTDEMEIAVNGTRTYRVARPGHDEHLVDIETAHCDCEDAHFRNVVCVHLVAACVHHAFADGVTTELVARVAGRVSETGCAHGHEFCAGPFGVGALPCDGCVESTRTGIWSVWKTLVGDSEVGR